MVEQSPKITLGEMRESVPGLLIYCLREALETVGIMADELATRDVLLGDQRIVAFAGDVSNDWATLSSRKRLDAAPKEVTSLSDYKIAARRFASLAAIIVRGKASPKIIGDAAE